MRGITLSKLSGCRVSLQSRVRVSNQIVNSEIRGFFRERQSTLYDSNFIAAHVRLLLYIRWKYKYKT